MKVMQFDLFGALPTNDELRAVQVSMESFHTYDVVTTHPLFAPAMISIVLLTLLFSVPRIRSWCWAWMYARAMYIYGIRGRYMLRKEQRVIQQAVQLNLLVDHIEEEVTKGRMTRTEANGWYGAYARVHPSMRYAIEKPVDVKAAIVERMKNMDRDKKGNIIPMKFPDSKREVPAAAERLGYMHVI